MKYTRWSAPTAIRLALALVVGVALFAVACGGGDDSASTLTATPTAPSNSASDIGYLTRTGGEGSPQSGPVSYDQMTQQIVARQIVSTTFVHKIKAFDDNAWGHAGDMSEFKTIFAALPPQ